MTALVAPPPIAPAHRFADLLDAPPAPVAWPAYGSPAERALVERAQTGDEAAFAVLYDHWQTPIYNFVYRLMGSQEDAYDLSQDAFVKAWLALTDPRNKAHTDPALRVNAWLYRIATNVCLDELRHRKLVRWQPWEAFISVFHPSQVATDSPERDAVRSEDAAEVEAILARLHPKHRAVLVLREYHDLSYDEIAEVLTTTRVAVKSLVWRAREDFLQAYTRAERRPGVVRDPATAPRRSA